MSEERDSKAKAIMSYSFLVAFANDGTLDKAEVQFIKKLALKDGIVDEDEKDILRRIFDRVADDNLTEDTRAEIASFREMYDI